MTFFTSFRNVAMIERIDRGCEGFMKESSSMSAADQGPDGKARCLNLMEILQKLV